MSNFLKLCEEFSPTNAKAKDAAFQAKFFLDEQGVKGWSSSGNTIFFQTDKGKVALEVKGFEGQSEEIPEEDDQIQAGVGSYDVSKEVDNLASTANSGAKGVAARLLGTSPQRAKQARNKRAKLSKKAVDVYEKDTKALEQGLRSAAMGNRSVATSY